MYSPRKKAIEADTGRSSLRSNNVATRVTVAKRNTWRSWQEQGLERGEWIRDVILREIARNSGDPSVSAELAEILGVRLMLTNVLRPLAAGQRLTPEVFDEI